MAKSPKDDVSQDYDVKNCVPGDLDEAELAACVAIIKRGDAVDPDSTQTELPRAKMLVVASKGDEIVAVGAIKRVRRGYASRIAKRSGVAFAPETPELGYVAVDPNHRNNRLSHRIVAELLSKHEGRLFATTFDKRMKKTLRKAGFVQKGSEWKGDNHRLSLWTKE